MKTPSIIVLAIALFMQVSCSVGQNVNTLTTDQVVEQLDKGGVILLDVRTPKEWNDGIIEGAVMMNFYDEDFATQFSTLDKSKPIIVTCKSGGRSPKAVAMMVKAGYNEVYDMPAGMRAWYKEKKKTVKPTK